MAKKKTATALNPAFDPRMLTIGAPNLYDPTSGKQIKNTIRRGWLVNDETALPASGLKGRVNFLYNPSEVNVSHGANTDSATSDQVAQAQSMGLDANEGVYALAPLGTLSLALLFDRTYELWDSSKKSTLAGQYGVYADVLAFYKMFGMVDGKTAPFIGPVLGDRPNHTNFNLFPSQYLAYPIIYVYLGPSSLKFHGAVVGFNINYTHWTRGMIPTRAGIDLTINLTPDPASIGKGQGGSLNWGSATLPGDITSAQGTTLTIPDGSYNPWTGLGMTTVTLPPGGSQ